MWRLLTRDKMIRQVLEFAASVSEFDHELFADLVHDETLPPSEFDLAFTSDLAGLMRCVGQRWHAQGPHPPPAAPPDASDDTTPYPVVAVTPIDGDVLLTGPVDGDESGDG